MFWFINSVFWLQSCCVMAMILFRVWKIQNSYVNLNPYKNIQNLAKKGGMCLILINLQGIICSVFFYSFGLTEIKRPWTPHRSGLVRVMWRDVMWCSYFLLIWSADSAVSCRPSLAPRTVNMLFRDKRGSGPSLELLLRLLACLGCFSVRSGAAGDDNLWYRDLCR